MASSFTLTIPVGGVSTNYSGLGAANGAATDLVAANAALDRVDQIIQDWISAFNTNSSSWVAQSGGAGSLSGSGSATAIATRLQNSLNLLTKLIHG